MQFWSQHQRKDLVVLERVGGVDGAWIGGVLDMLRDWEAGFHILPVDEVKS